MEILTSNSIPKKEQNYKRKNEIICKYKIKEGKNINKYLRQSYFIHLNTFNNISKNSKKKTPVRARRCLPILNLNKNIIIETENKDNNNNEDSLNIKNKSLRFHKRYNSKDEIIKTTIFPNKEIKLFNDNKKYINNNNTTFIQSDSINREIVQKNKINNFSPIKNTIFNEIIQRSAKNDLKYIKLSNINYNKKKLFGEYVKNSYEKHIEDFNYNPIKLNNESDMDKKEKIILGAKYSTFDLSPDSISKSKFNSKLSNYIKKIKEKKKSNKKINLSKIDLHKLKLKSYQNQRINNYRKLIDSSVKDVIEVKNSCLNWINDLREKYSDLYKGLGIEKTDEYY